MAGSTRALPTASPEAAAISGVPAGPALTGKHVSLGLEAWRRFRRHRLAVASLAILGLMVLTVVLGPLLWHLPVNDSGFPPPPPGPAWAQSVWTPGLGPGLLAAPLLWRGGCTLVGVCVGT